MIHITEKKINKISKEDIQKFDAVLFVLDEKSFKKKLAQDSKLREIYLDLLKRKAKIILTNVKDLNQVKEFLRKITRVLNLRKILIVYR